MVRRIDLLLPFLGGVGEGGRCGPAVRCPGCKGLYAGKSAASEHFSYIPGEVDRRGAKHKTGGDALSVPQCLGMGRVVGGGLWELVAELSNEPLAGNATPGTAAVWRWYKSVWLSRQGTKCDRQL